MKAQCYSSEEDIIMANIRLESDVKNCTFSFISCDLQTEAFHKNPSSQASVVHFGRGLL